MNPGRSLMLITMLLIPCAWCAANPLRASGAVIIINIPLGNVESDAHAPSIGFDFDMPKNAPLRSPLHGPAKRRKPVVPLELELTGSGPYRIKVGGFYLDSLN